MTTTTRTTTTTTTTALLLLTALVLALLLGVSEAAVYKGSLSTKAHWRYMYSFCFSDLQGHGVPKMVMTHPKGIRDTYIEMYINSDTLDDKNKTWKVVREHTPTSSHPWTCEELKKHAFHRLELQPGGKSTIEVPVFVRAYYFYMSLSNCKGPIEVPSYTVTFLNPGGLWYRQFSYDLQGIGPIFIFFFLAYTVLLAVHGWGVYQQMQTESWHPIIRILSVCIALEVLACLSQLIHYAVYANNGIGAPALRGLGDLLNMASNIALIFLLILIAKGWAITTSYLANKNVIIIVLGLFGLSYLALFIWDNAMPDGNLYFYDNWPGLIVLILRFGTWLWFVWSLRGTIRLESLPEKRQFYFIFGGAYSVWFMALPIFVLIGLLMAPEMRFRTVTGLAVSMEFLSLAALAFLLWPSRASNYFVIKTSPQLLSVNEEGGSAAATGGYGATSAHDAL
eukprot:TRINITY_DN153_c0_g2_i1.p1 TRINITY_DN153_c0_g2~~TRINITY_DN153_c0_g2_i1.p1  ORF type:complete len:451 (-),score=111.84 TRINITY_DN153_c0_g2_i1:1569-2921(-)